MHIKITYVLVVINQLLNVCYACVPYSHFFVIKLSVLTLKRQRVSLKLKFKKFNLKTEKRESKRERNAFYTPLSASSSGIAP